MKNLLKKFRTQIQKKAKEKDHTHIEPHVLQQALNIAEESLVTRQKGKHKITITQGTKKDDKDKHDQTLIVIITDDRPFLIDSVTAECVYNHHTIEGLIHNTLLVERDGKGCLKSLETKTGKAQKDWPRESLIIMALSGLYGKERAKTLEKNLNEIITDVDFATQDWQKMRKALQDCVSDFENAPKTIKDYALFDEYKAFLNYLHDNNFTLLGYREYKLSDKGKTAESKIVKGSGLGLLSDDKKPVYINKTRQHLPGELQKRRINQNSLTVAKVNKRSTVHRRVPIDAIAVKTYDKKGKVTGEKLFIGLFTSVTYSRSIQDVPFIRHKVNEVIEQTGFGVNSHNYRALMHILEKYPRDELFQIETQMLRDYAISIMALQEQPKVALYVREDPFKRYISCLVYVPREKYETDLRVAIQNILSRELNGECDAFYTVLDDSPLARVIYTVRIEEDDANKKYNFKKIEEKLIEAGRSWEEKIAGILLQECATESDAIRLTQKYAKAFPIAYQYNVDLAHVFVDVQKIESVSDTDQFALDLYEVNDQLRLKMYNPKSSVILSDILPVLENFGFQVIAEKPFEVKLPDYGSVWIHDFLVEYKNPDHANAVKDIKKVFEEGLTAILNKECENDALNALIPMAKMPWRDVLVLRAYTKYMRQTQVQYTPTYMMQALTDFPDIADLFLELFYGYHKPVHSQEKRDDLVKVNTRKINKALEKVVSYDQDRILRSLLQIHAATLRTNFFQEKSYVSFKLDSSKIDILPFPRPMVEIFVYSPRVEGVHLRGGKVARGGLRWSDRHEDFRTEVLGLMKAQNVKNSVIIPVGSKGGFVVKQPPKDKSREAMQEEGIACYKIFISGLLDITDNIQGKKIIPPKNVVRHDADDPYLVVAADKGTATFSDIANGLSQDYGFWLGDAFASGGSAGYDHKAMGITARGAWESVKRHFRELGKNIQEEPFDVIGVGDMGGDVFGNGMLLSEHIRLVGAFNHLHIFCDPNPDCASSYKERKRLFEAVKGWDAYDEKTLSKGGRIFSRQDKSLKLTPEIRERFHIDKKECSPLELMNAMLKAETDLMWFGGIGTYVKAPSENNADVGDKANDMIRVDAHEVRAKVIGEGANLGVTHKARIAMSLLGIKLYADFIDNAGGVNSSDLEVNIKILFAQIMQNTKLTIDQRNKILEQMTGDVANLVLRNNYQQTQGISVASHNAYEKLSSHASLIDHLEAHAGLDRNIEFLPSEESIENRGRDHQGLTAPEISILVSYAKIKLFQDLVESGLPDDPSFQDWMVSYFPDLLQKKYRNYFADHRLRREIIATQLANSLVNRMGPDYIMNQASKTSASPEMIARAYFSGREAYSLTGLYAEIEGLDNKVPAAIQIRALDEMAVFLDYATTWFLKLSRDNGLSGQDMHAKALEYKKEITKLRKQLSKTLPQSTQNFIDKRQEMFVDNGLPKSIASELALLPVLNTACDIIRIAHEKGQDVATVARVYFGLNEVFSFVWLRDKTRNFDPESRWEADTLRAITDRLYNIQTELTKRVVAETCGDKICPTDPVGDWVKKGNGAIQSVIDSVNGMKDAEDINFAMITAIETRLAQLG
jgi:glutamate dehydrogenase